MTGKNFNDYTHAAKKQNKTDIVFSAASYMSAAVLWFSSSFIDGIKYVPVLQLCALTALVVGIYINQRYTWVRYVYGVIPGENKNSGEITAFYFVIYRTVGKRQNCLLKVDIRDCLRLIDCTHKDDHKNELSVYVPYTRYDFRATMAPAEYCRVVMKADGETVVAAFEPDETLRAIMRANTEKKTDDA